MGSEQPNVETINSSGEPAQALTIPRWAIITVLLILSLPLLMMSSVMLAMGWMGPPMHGEMMGINIGIIRIVGVIPLLLVTGMLYGVYRLYEADKE